MLINIINVIDVEVSPPLLWWDLWSGSGAHPALPAVGMLNIPFFVVVVLGVGGTGLDEEQRQILNIPFFCSGCW